MGNDPKRRYCSCGYNRRFNKLVYIRLLFKDYTWKCPRCGRIHKYRMTYYCNEIFDKDSKEDNKALVEGKKSLWSKS